MPINCPYCMNPIDKGTVNYECPQCGQVYKAAGLFHNKVPQCKNKSAHASTLLASVVRCPHCQERLPIDFLDYDRSLKFSLVGTTSSGKTNFLIVMLHELMHTLKTGMAISALDTTRDYYRNFKEFERIMFVDHKLLPATETGTVDPYLWRVRDRNKAKGNFMPSYGLTIYDGAGENFDRLDESEKTAMSKYLCETSTLFILIDPFQLDSFRARGTVDNISSAPNSQNATTSLEKVAKFIHDNAGLAGSQTIDMNIAIIFTKIDALQDLGGPLFGDSDLIYSRGDDTHIGCFDFRRNGFDSNLAKQISDSIRTFLEQEEPAFINAVTTNFVASKVNYFAVSALGNPPQREDDGQVYLRHIDPIRILDPFLWMMAQEGLIKKL